MSLSRRFLLCLRPALRAGRPGVSAVAARAVLDASLSLRWASAKKKQPPPSATAAGSDDAAGDDDAGVDPAKIKEAMSKHIAYAQREFSKIRGSTANPAMLDHVIVEAYGESQPLKGVAQITLKSPTLLLVTPFDAALCPAVAEAIRGAGLSLNPGVDGNSVKVPIPRPSAESRDASLKVVGKVAEAAKGRIRRTRQSAIDNLKKTAGACSRSEILILTSVVR